MQGTHAGIQKMDACIFARCHTALETHELGNPKQIWSAQAMLAPLWKQS